MSIFAASNNRMNISDNSFASLNIREEILHAVSDLGFEKLMPVQAEVLPLLLNDNMDIVTLAQTGTGKTATFGIPILEKIDLDNTDTQVLILSPTRELCIQITNDMLSYAKYINKVSIVPVYGGTSIETQIKSIKKGAQIIVATPGRMIDLMNRKVINISKISVLVLDEADEMLNMGFQEDIDTILERTPDSKNVWLFSATMPAEVEKIARSFMNSPKVVTIGNRNAGAENVQHFYYLVHAKDRYLALKRIADFYPNIYAIVFCRTKVETQEVADALIKDGYNADALHGDLSQAQRDHVMNKFRNRNIQMLVATDVAARGLDVFNLSHVINYNLPDEAEQYVHRSGRTGRAEKTGISIAIINLKEKNKIKSIEKVIGKEFIKANIPTGKEVCKKQLFNIINNMENVDMSNEAEIDSFLPLIYGQLDWLSKEEIIKRFVSLEFNRFLNYYRNAPDLNVEEKKESRERKNDRKSRRNDYGDRKSQKSDSKYSKNGFSTVAINLGRRTGTVPQRIIGVINDTVNNRDMRIGHIDIYDNYSLVEIESKYLNDFFNAFDSRYDDKYHVEYVEDEQNSKNSRSKDKATDRTSGKGRGDTKSKTEGKSRGGKKEQFDKDKSSRSRKRR
ncbi:MAG: DEAD/DEAH box helicase [Bacteroidales bacterium]|nr:DEAD/DEAH box helicase [Bacteroidales bacterium]MDD3913595.1 DEAD/DEAH box helicase [Bacteroidales bacterium]MDD4633637.1 DEAD/DEAH box helicase [Bacteroidales bacterium]